MNSQELTTILESAGLCPPETLTIAMTGECNLACAHCWVDAGPDNSAPPVPGPVLCQLLTDFVRLGGAKVRLTGGEPLLHPDWLGVLSYALELGLERIILQTNAMLFDADDLSVLRRLRTERLQIQVSLDGARAEAHDLVRGAGAFRQTLNGLQRLVSYGLGPQLAIFFTEMRHNLQELPELFNLAAELGVGSVSSGTLVSCGRAASADRIAPPTPEQYLALLQKYRTDERFRTLYQKLGCIAAVEWCNQDIPVGTGCAFVRTPYLTAAGTLYPCLMCHADGYGVDSVYEKGLAAALVAGGPLWSSLQEISRQRATTIAECQECPLLESCGGGCMGRAWGSFGDFLVAEDRCRQRQTVFRWKEKN